MRRSGEPQRLLTEPMAKLLNHMLCGGDPYDKTIPSDGNEQFAAHTIPYNARNRTLRGLERMGLVENKGFSPITHREQWHVPDFPKAQACLKKRTRRQARDAADKKRRATRADVEDLTFEQKWALASKRKKGKWPAVRQTGQQTVMLRRLEAAKLVEFYGGVSHGHYELSPFGRDVADRILQSGVFEGFGL